MYKYHISLDQFDFFFIYWGTIFKVAINVEGCQNVIFYSNKLNFYMQKYHFSSILRFNSCIPSRFDGVANFLKKPPAKLRNERSVTRDCQGKHLDNSLLKTIVGPNLGSSL